MQDNREPFTINETSFDRDGNVTRFSIHVSVYPGSGVVFTGYLGTDKTLRIDTANSATVEDVVQASAWILAHRSYVAQEIATVENERLREARYQATRTARQNA